ncbi:MAG: hypothetical protein PHP42_08350 [Bacteroidota bacterium]|nr:hypothetical protein [Bacteroidota bacterium]
MNEARKRFFSGLPFTSKLITEDETIKEMKYKNGGVLYERLYMETFKGGTRTGEMSDDPISFYVFAMPRFRNSKNHNFKIVCNPSRITVQQLLDFLYRNFQTQETIVDRVFQKKFRLGRVDFAVDVPDYTVDELRRMIYVANKTRKHTSIFSVADDGSGYIRVISAKEPETFYVGKGDVVLRVYNKVLEARYQIAVCKREQRTIPERLKKIAEMPQLTRIELQIRSLGTLGIKEHNGIKSSSLKRGFYRLTTLWQLLNMKQKHFDVFDDIIFNPLTSTDYFSLDWMNQMFNCVIKEKGLDESVKMLPKDRRKKIKEYINEQKFNHNLNEICWKEIQSWLTN